MSVLSSCESKRGAFELGLMLPVTCLLHARNWTRSTPPVLFNGMDGSLHDQSAVDLQAGDRDLRYSLAMREGQLLPTWFQDE